MKCKGGRPGPHVPAVSNLILIKNGEVHVGTGQILSECDVLIADGKIKQVQKNIETESQTEIIDASGCIVFPGFIDTMNTWGANGPAWSDNDLNEHTDPIAPHLNSVYAFDPCAMNFQEVYRYGVTSFGLAPSIYNVIGGRISVFKTFGTNPYEMLVKEDAAMAASVSDMAKEVYRSKKMCPMTKMGIFSLLRQALYDAADESRNDEKSIQLRRVLKKEMPLFINCTTRADIDNVDMLLEEFDLDVVVTGAYEITDAAAHRFSRIVLGNLTDSMRPENYETDISGIKRMMKEGSLFAISSCGDSSAGGKESLLWNGILYYQRGIAPEEVLRMLTLNPAEILGVSGITGSIEENKDADIVIWSKNPILTYEARVMHCFIGGVDLAASERRTSCW